MTVDLLAILGSLLIVASCASGPGGSRSSGAWQSARTVAEAHLRSKYGEPPAWKIAGEASGTPFLFRVQTPGDFALLVHDGKVIEQRGLGALDRYLREARCVEQRTTTLEELMTLIQHLQTLPPHPKPLSYVRLRAETEAWRPHLDFLDGGRATLRLYYIVESTGDHDSDNEDGHSVLVEWTLSMDPGQAPVWTEKTRVWDPERSAFSDVDHAK